MKSLSKHKLHPKARPSTVHLNFRHYPGSAKGSMVQRAVIAQGSLKDNRRIVGAQWLVARGGVAIL